MRYLTFFLLAILVSGTSCSNIQFKEAQPSDKKAITRFPNKFIGKYVYEQDTIIIKKESVYFGEEASLSDSLMVKKLKNKYFFNVYDKNRKTWSVFLFNLTPEKNLKVTDVAVEGNDELKHLKRFMNLDKQKDSKNETYYLASPNKQQWKKMLKKEVFKDFNIYYRLND